MDPGATGGPGQVAAYLVAAASEVVHAYATVPHHRTEAANAMGRISKSTFAPVQQIAEEQLSMERGVRGRTGLLAANHADLDSKAVSGSATARSRRMEVEHAADLRTIHGSARFHRVKRAKTAAGRNGPTGPVVA